MNIGDLSLDDGVYDMFRQCFDVHSKSFKIPVQPLLESSGNGYNLPLVISSNTLCDSVMLTFYSANLLILHK